MSKVRRIYVEKKKDFAVQYLNFTVTVKRLNV